MATQVQTHILVDTDAERLHKGRTRNVRIYTGPGKDGSSADKLSLDSTFNPWDTAITFRTEWGASCKTVFTQFDPLKSWSIEQSSPWFDDVKAFPHRHTEEYDRGTSMHIPPTSRSRSAICVSLDRPTCTPDLLNEKRVTLNKRQKKHQVPVRHPSTKHTVRGGTF